MTITSSEPTVAPQYPMEKKPTCPFAPAEELRQLAAQSPISRVQIWDGSTPWLVGGYAEMKALTSDPRVSVDDTLPGFPHWNAFVAQYHRPRSVFNSDGEQHSHYRRMMTKPFTVKKVNELRPAIQRIVDEKIDAMLNRPKPVDLVTALALPVPSLVISEILGVPEKDRQYFEEEAFHATDHDATVDEKIAAAQALIGYLTKLVEQKMANPSDDHVSELARRVKAGEIPLAEAAYLAAGLLSAGHETTANMIGLGVAALLQSPDQLAIMRDSTDMAVTANAVNELLRYLSIVHHGQRRIALEDIKINGVHIQAGDGIILDLSPANWDERVFPNPGQLDLHRPAGSHVAFGFGPHQCVGQQLARAELQIVYPTLFRRIPSLQLAIPASEIPFMYRELAFGVYSLPVTW
ncbi:cytochrome P450 [Mycolicibacterium goodii]|uniref:cytochrome P450 n=1 Tax=Mycolicibacterium goodii TaxID=134601 RepID=UPI000C25DE34|nr:cytochrome P450 [Mycolicibacterium goodii]PJK20437.1 cytochrome P450 [Mycolicibacterium goodii]